MLTPSQEQKFQAELFDFLRIPSISTLPEHKADVLRAVSFITDYVSALGFTNVEHLYADGMSEENAHPVLYAERISDPKLPTVLIYGHYDVQPVDPLDQWKNPPFEPEVRDGFIYARGATDDKGQSFTHLAALSLLAEKWGENWPVNFKLLFEGEEEMGSENLSELIKEQDPKSSKLLADICVVSDGPWIGKENPSIEYGLRGLTYMQIDVKLAEADMHSGLFGGGVRNPANALAQIISQLQDSQTGKVLVPGFYDAVVDISADEREKLAQIPLTPEQFLSDANQAKAVFTEAGYSLIEGISARPTLDVNGIWGGFSGEGAKTIIPASAHAKVSMRLVANQDPDKIAELFTEYVQQIAPAEVEVSVTKINSGDAMLTDLDAPEIKLAADAMHQVFGGEVVFTRSGGSIPPIAMLQSKLGIKPIMINYGFPDDNMHSPNERFSLDQFFRGIECNQIFYESLA